MKTPWVKICGITREKDALLAQSLGAKALGFILHSESPRYLNPHRIAEIMNSLPRPHPDLVGVMVNPDLAAIREVLAIAPLTHLQLHGQESPEFCAEVRQAFPQIKLIKALRLNSAESKIPYPVDFELFDHQTQTEWGGTGQTISWVDARTRRNSATHSFILAGGLKPENIREAVQIVNPDGLDLSSGVEEAPGLKSESKLRAFFLALNANSSEEHSS